MIEVTKNDRKIIFLETKKYYLSLYKERTTDNGLLLKYILSLHNKYVLKKSGNIANFNIDTKDIKVIIKLGLLGILLFKYRKYLTDDIIADINILNFTTQCCGKFYFGYKSHDWTIKSASNFFRNDHEIAEIILSENGFYLEYFDITIRKNDDIIELAKQDQMLQNRICKVPLILAGRVTVH